MRNLIKRLKPTAGFAHYFHFGLQALLPAVIFVLIRLDKTGFVQLALILVVLSKWRMLAVKPRFWPANIRANAVDIIVGLSMVLFMNHSTVIVVQIVLMLAYIAWLTFIKPGSSLLMLTTQAFVAQLAGLMALYMVWPNGPLAGLTVITGLVCYLAARHFFDSFEETHAKMLSFFWGYFGAALAWLTTHWLLFYAGVAQVTLLLCSLGYGMASLYYLGKNKRLNKTIQRQFVFIMIAIVLVVLVFSSWHDKVLTH